MAERIARFRSEIDAALAALAAPLPPHTAPSGPDETALLDAVRSILEAGEAGGQREILRAVLDGGTRCFERTVLFIGRGDRLVGWERRGDRALERPAADLAAAGEHLAARARSAGGMALAGPEGPGEELVASLGGDRPEAAAAAPLIVRGRAVAVLYGDARTPVSAAHMRWFDLLARVGGASLELRSLRRRSEATAPVPAGARAAITVITDSGSQAPGAVLRPAAPEEAEMQALLGDLEVLPRREDGEGGLSPEEQRQHNDARRFASLLVSELLLYNEEAVILGRKQRDLARRLAPEIERTRRAYEARIPRVIQGGRYLEDELVRVLADGDEALLSL